MLKQRPNLELDSKNISVHSLSAMQALIHHKVWPNLQIGAFFSIYRSAIIESSV